MTAPKCIVCGKPIKKLIRSLSFYPAAQNGRENYERNGTTMYLDRELRPANKEEAQRYVNHPITRLAMSSDRVFTIFWWEGDYEDDFFHSQRCAAKQGYASARHGDRWQWENGG